MHEVRNRQTNCRRDAYSRLLLEFLSTSASRDLEISALDLAADLQVQQNASTSEESVHGVRRAALRLMPSL